MFKAEYIFKKQIFNTIEICTYVSAHRFTSNQRFVSSTGNMEVLLSHTHSIVCAYILEGQMS